MALAEQMRREGEAIGLVKGQRAMLTKLLRLKFKHVGPEHEALIAEATLGTWWSRWGWCSC